MSGYCNLQASAVPSRAVARCTRPSEAARAGPTHRRRIGLQLDQLADIFLGQRLGDCGEELRDLHQGALDAAERRAEIGGVTLAVYRNTQVALAGKARAEPGHRAADPRVAAHPAGETVFIAHR